MTPLLHLLAAFSSCPSQRAQRDLEAAGYASDHLNYLCTNWTRPTPLPCKPAVTQWLPRWGKRFVIHSWWPPLPSDYEAYAEAGFNLALLRGDSWVNVEQEKAYAEGEDVGKRWRATHDGLFEAVIEESAALARLGVMSVFTQVQLAPEQQPRATQAYGNRTGGVVRGRTNITTKAYQSHPFNFDTGDVRSYMQTVPEVEYLISELSRRNISHRFAGLFLADDTVTQPSFVIRMAEFLQQHAPWLIPMVNQVGGNSGPETLYRSKLFISSPEQYPIVGCLHGECDPRVPITADTIKAGTAINASAAAAAQQAAYQDNAFNDMRFGLHHWPLFMVGQGNGPLNWTNGSSTQVPPDFISRNLRSDSLVRWMAYSAIAFGAKALNYYCWGGGVYYAQTCGCPAPVPEQVRRSGRQTCGCNTSLPGRPTPTYATVREVNADASKWGDLLLANDFAFAFAFNSAGSWNSRGQLVGPTGDSTPSDATLVAAMSDDLLASCFLSKRHRTRAFVFVVSKRVSPYLPAVPPRNVTITLHPSVLSAAAVSPGEQGRTGFDLGGGLPTRQQGRVRHHYAHTGRDARGRVTVTVELVGGGGGLLQLEGLAAGMRDAAYAKSAVFFDPAGISLASDKSGGSQLKSPSWGYGSFAFGGSGNTGYMPLNDMELESGLPFEGGEQTAFILGGSLTAPLSGPKEAKAWAWAGYNMLSMPSPTPSDLSAYGAVSRAFGDLLDWGFSYGYFGLLEAAEGEVMGERQVVTLVESFRCHGRMGGLMIAAHHPNLTSVSLAAKSMAGVAQGAWLLPFAAANSASDAVALGELGVALAMPSLGGGHPTALAAAAAAAAEYGVMRAMLSIGWEGLPQSEEGGEVWARRGSMVFVASVNACAYDSDSLTRWHAFAAVAFGARGVWWRHAGRCAPAGSDKFALLRSINTRLKGWGDIFVASASPARGPHGYNITKLTTGEGWPMPDGCGVTAPTSSSLVESLDDDVLVAELGALGHYSTPLVYIVNRRVSLERGGAPVRTVRVRLRGVAGSQPLEGDCRAGECQCGAGVVGPEVVLRLPGGSGQLVALSMLNSSLLDPTAREHYLHNDVPAGRVALNRETDRR